MFKDFYINGQALKNALNISAAIDTDKVGAQGDVMVVTNTNGVLTVARPADTAAAQGAQYVISNENKDKDSFDFSYGGKTAYAAGELVRLFDLKSLEGGVAPTVTLSESIIDKNSLTLAVGGTLIPVHTGGWQRNDTVTGYSYYLKIENVREDFDGGVYDCSVVVAG